MNLNIYYRHGIKIQNLGEPTPKFCPENKNNIYYADIDIECNPDLFDKSCITTISNCFLCRNATFCEDCQLHFSSFEGNCVQNCPIGYCLDFNKRNCETCKGFEVSDDSSLFCNQKFQDCLRINSCQNCAKEYFNKYCILELNSNFDCNPCSGAGCLKCYHSGQQEYCYFCQVGYYFYNYSCLLACPKGTFYYNSKCLESCDHETQFVLNNKCIDCKYSREGLIEYKICPDLCQPYEIFRNNTCHVTKENCLIYRGGHCVYCNFKSFEMIKGKCLPNYQQNSKFEYMKYNSDSLQFLDFIIYCPPSCQLCTIANLSFLCNDKENRSIVPPSIFDITLEFTNYNCPEYIEGMNVVRINDSCLKYPNTHFYLLQSTHFLLNRSVTKYFSTTNFYTRVKICNFSSSDILCVSQCPKGYYQVDEQECLLCSRDTFFCYNRSQFYSNEEFLDKTFPNEGNYNLLIGGVLLSMNGTNYNYLYLKPPQPCPIECKSCYSIGNKFICTSCLIPEMILTQSFSCTCISGIFDLEKLECVQKCPPGYVQTVTSCLPNCDKSPQFLYRLPRLFNIDKDCAPTCPVNYYPTTSFINDDQFECVGMLLWKNNGNILELKNQSVNNELLETLLHIGISSLVFQWRYYTMLQQEVYQVLADAPLSNVTYANKIVSTLMLFANQPVQTEIVLKCLERAQQIMTLYRNDMDIVYKFAYFKILMVRSKWNMLNGLLDNTSYSIEAKTIGNFHINIINLNFLGKEIKITFDFDVIGRISYSSVELLEEFIIVFSITPGYNNGEYLKMIISAKLNDFYMKMTNLSKESSIDIFLEVEYKIFRNEIYFIHFSKSPSAYTNLNIMISENLYYLKKNFETDEEPKNDLNKNMVKEYNIKILIIFIFCLFGGWILFSIYRYLRKTTEEATKIKFVQMAEVEQEEFEDNLEEF